MSESKKVELTPSLAILVAGVLIAGAVVFTNTRSAPVAPTTNDSPITDTAVSAPTAEDHIIGSATAPLVLIEYADLQCYYCSVANPTIQRLVTESEGKIAWVFRHLPLESIHPEARPSALASECVAEQLGNDGFWQFANTMYANQDKMNSKYYEDTAVGLGANLSQFKSCVASEKFADKIDIQGAEAAQNGARGTPFTILYDSRGQTGVSGALPYPTFASVIKAFQNRQ